MSVVESILGLSDVYSLHLMVDKALPVSPAVQTTNDQDSVSAPYYGESHDIKEQPGSCLQRPDFRLLSTKSCLYLWGGHAEEIP